MFIFQNFDFSHLQSEASWLVIIYGAMLFAMFIDLITGVYKAKQLGQLRTSRGFRRTAEKATQYMLPMFCLTLIDVIASVMLDYPFLTGIMAAFNIYIELRSVWENTHTQEQTVEQEQCAKDLIKFVSEHRSDIEKILQR